MILGVVKFGVQAEPDRGVWSLRDRSGLEGYTWASQVQGPDEITKVMGTHGERMRA